MRGGGRAGSRAPGGVQRRAILTMMIQLGLSIAAPLAARATGQQPPNPGPAWAVRVQDFSRDRVVFDSGAARGADAVAIPLTIDSLDAPDGAEIEVRFVRADTGAQVYPWRRLGTLAGGRLEARYEQPSAARSVHWLRPQARVVGSSALAEPATACGVGHVWAIWEQSNWGRIFNDYNSNLAPLYEPAVNPGDVQVWHWSDLANGPAATDATNSYANGTRVTPAMVAFANALQAVRPGEKFMILGHVKGGTSYDEALTDATALTGSRDWNDEVALHQAATANGEQVGVVWNCGWAASNFSASHVDDTLRKFIGRSIDGSPADQTAGFPFRGWSANTTYGADHGGLYDWTYSRFGYAGPHGRVRAQMRGVSAAAVTQFGDLPSYDDPANNDDAIYRQIVLDLDLAFNGRAATFPEVLPWVGTTHGAERGAGPLGNGDDLAHMRATDPLGRNRLASIGAHNMMQSLGWMASPLPRLDRRHDAPDGAWSDQWIDGNNTLTTLRRALPADPQHGATTRDLADSNGAAIPPGEDHRTEVMGWSINRVAAQRAEMHVVTAAEVAAGHPAAEGQVVCRVWPNFGGTFTSLDEIVYGIDHWPGYLVYGDGGNLLDAPDRQGNRTFLDWLVVDMGQPRGVLEWLPVQHQGLVFTQTTTLPLPEFFRREAGTTVTRPNAGIAATSAFTFEIEGRFDATAGGRHLFDTSGNNTKIQMLANGSLRIDMGDARLTLNAFVQAGALFYLRVVYVNGGEIAAFDGPGPDAALLGISAGTGFYGIGGADKLFTFARSNGGEGRDIAPSGTFSKVAFYLDATDATGTPDYAIEGAAGAPPYRLTGFTEGDIHGGTLTDGAA